MRRRRANLNQTSYEPVNVTPLIDVVMCLIIFFLIVGKLAGDQASLVRLPTSSVGRGERDDRAVIVAVAPASAAAGGTLWGGVLVRISVDGLTAKDPTELQRLLRELGGAKLLLAGLSAADLKTLPVVVRADRDLPFAAVEPALAALASVGINQVDYATQRVEAGPSASPSAGPSVGPSGGPIGGPVVAPTASPNAAPRGAP